MLFQVRTGDTHVLVTYLTMSHYTASHRWANNERSGKHTKVCGYGLLTVTTTESAYDGKTAKNGSARTNDLPTKVRTR